MRDFDEICEQGLQATDIEDGGKWIHGELALEVEKDYGKDRLGEFARRVKKGRRSIEQRRQVMALYLSNEPAFAKLKQSPVLSWSHFRTACRCETVEESIAFLEDCANNARTVDEAEYLLSNKGKDSSRVKVGEFDCVAHEFDSGQVSLLLFDEGNTLQTGAKYHLVLYQEKPTSQEVRDYDSTLKLST